MSHGAGGARVLIDPDSLRSAAARLRATVGELGSVRASLGGVGWPAMPPGLLVVAQNAVAEAQAAAQAQSGPLSGTVVELTRRAFWAQYADQMSAGYKLSDPRFTGSRLPVRAQQEFVNYLRDGTLLANATPAQVKMAARELARIYADFRTNPQMVVDLSHALWAVERSGMPPEELKAFSASFINTFGAKNMDEIPRMLQAMEYSQRIEAEGALGEPSLRQQGIYTDTAKQWSDEGGGKLPESSRDLLASFSIMVANASMSGKLTAVVEDKIASSSDTWATAALLSGGGKFSVPFLLAAYRKGVVDQIVAESWPHPLDAGNDELGFQLGGSDGKDGLPADTKVIVLEALARNDKAAAAALSEQFHPPVQVWDHATQGTVPVKSPIELLYRYGHFSDSGAAFGKMYVVATDHLHAGGVGDVYKGSTLTKEALEQMLTDDHGGMSAFKDGIATDLAHNHIKDLFTSVGNSNDDGITVNSTRVIAHTAVARGSLSVSQSALTRVIQHLADQPTALNTLLHAGATYQAAVIDVNTRAAPDGDATWIRPVAAFDVAVLNGTELNRAEDFRAAEAKHEAVMGFFKNVTTLVVSIDPVADTIVSQGVSAGLDDAIPGPDPTHLVLQNLDAKIDLHNTLRASLVAGYYQNGVIKDLPPEDIAPHGKLISYGLLESGKQPMREFNAWMSGKAVSDVVDPAYNEVTNVIEKDGVDLVG